MGFEQSSAASAFNRCSNPGRSWAQEVSALTALCTDSHEDFPLELLWAETMRHAFNRVRVINGQLVELGAALYYLYFSRIGCIMMLK